PYSVLENHQMGLYAWALHKLKGYQWIEGSLYFLRYRKESKHFFNLLDIEKARTWAETLANEIESKLSILDMLPEAKNQLFPDSPSKSCRH
ncbi:MAG TPA: PD-(D/E)XK nuclease family protein, partial [Paenibacillaceae bacterium]|nr:PD-(D/E)XK nuclease family protein [Paenibacillaceae bacterium]